MNTSTKLRNNIRRKPTNRPSSENSLLSIEASKKSSERNKPKNAKSRKNNNKMYKSKVIAVEFFNYFKRKGDVFVTQNEILNEFIRQGWSKSHVYLKLKKFSEGIVKRSFGSDKVDIFEPLLLEVSRLEIDGKTGICYKLNECWKEVKVEDIAKTFYGK